MNRARLRTGVAASIVVTAGIALPVPAGAQPPLSEPAPPKIEFHLQSQFVGDALTAVGQQSGLTIAVSSTLAQGLKSAPLDGRYTPTEALVRILADTGLRAEFLDRNTVVVIAASLPVHTSSQRQIADKKPAPHIESRPSRDPRPHSLSSPCSASDSGDATDSCKDSPHP